MSFKADAVIIGAGLAGLTAAAMLSKRGHKVIVLERDIHPGGCAAGFTQDGYRFAVGATVAMGLETGGLVRSIYDQLGLKPRYVAVDPAIRVHLPDRTINLHTGAQAWLEEVRTKFPGQTKAKRAFWQDIGKLSQAMYQASKCFPVMPFKHLNDLLDTAKAAHPRLLSVLVQLRRSVADKLQAYGIEDEAHLAFINGQLLDSMQTTAEHCVLPNGALALDIYRQGCQYKIGGLESIAEDLANYVRQHGGEVHYASRAKLIAHHNNVIQGVSSNRGDIETPVVISAIPMTNTFKLLASAPASNLGNRVAEQAEMWGAFTLYLGVDERVLPDDVHFYEQVTDLNVHDAGNVLISISPSWDRSRAPEGKRAITVSTHVNAKQWMAFAEDKEVYRQEKQRMQERLLNQVEKALPNIREGLEVIMSGSPRSFKNFTLRHDGMVGGFAQTKSNANFNAPSHRTDIKGLYLAGDTIFPGQGTLGVSVSGYNAARTAARYLMQLPQQHSTFEEVIA